MNRLRHAMLLKEVEATEWMAWERKSFSDPSGAEVGHQTALRYSCRSFLDGIIITSIMLLEATFAEQMDREIFMAVVMWNK